MVKTLVMVRHGAPSIKYKGCFMGKTNVGLSVLGRKQAAALAGPMGNLGEAHFIVSPLRRARETARIALAATKQSFDVVPGLREIDFGSWEGKTFDQISQDDPLGVQRWSNFEYDFVFPGGEAIGSFIERVRILARRIVDDPEETVVIITHGGIIRFLICHFLGLYMNHYLLFDVHPASISVITLYDGQGVLTRLNDLCHLDGSDCG